MIDVQELRSGYHEATLTEIAGVEHDERCLAAADEIESLRADLSDALDRAAANLERAVAAEDKLTKQEQERD